MCSPSKSGSSSRVLCCGTLDLQNGSFIRVNELILKRKMEMMQESQKQQIQTENILLVLNKLIHNVIRIIDRFVFFFKGILLGMRAWL